MDLHMQIRMFHFAESLRSAIHILKTYGRDYRNVYSVDDLETYMKNIVEMMDTTAHRTFYYEENQFSHQDNMIRLHKRLLQLIEEVSTLESKTVYRKRYEDRVFLNDVLISDPVELQKKFDMNNRFIFSRICFLEDLQSLNNLDKEKFTEVININTYDDLVIGLKAYIDSNPPPGDCNNNEIHSNYSQYKIRAHQIMCINK